MEDLEHSSRLRSLRWKALITLSLILLLVNASLALLAYRQSVAQFELQQADIRQSQTRQLNALLEEGFERMSKLAYFVPLLETYDPADTLAVHLAKVLDQHGFMLDVEWDIRTVQLIAPDGELWTFSPSGGELPEALMARFEREPDENVDALLCRMECLQYSAVPILWKEELSGRLILSRTIADPLQEFHALTGAQVAMLRSADRERVQDAPVHTPRVFGMAVPAITDASQTLPLIEAAAASGILAAIDQQPAVMSLQGEWYEFYRIVPDLSEGVRTYVVNRVTAQQLAIRDSLRNSIFIGILGLIVSESLLLLVLHAPLARIRRLVATLPLLAENRFDTLRERLPWRSGRGMSMDEIDVMVHAVGRLTDRMEDMQRRRDEAESRLVWLADHDPLTHLFNRRRFTEGFESILQQAVRYERRGALLFFDLDQFKDVNDLSGHHAGDSLLRRVADRLRLLLRASDLLGRLGGDEFAVVMPESSEEQALAAADRIQAVIQEIVLSVRQHRHRVSASIGIVLFPDHGADSHTLLANADLTMYMAKDKGRGRCQVFSLEDQAREKVDARVVWMDQIDQALKQGRFELYFQPIVELASGVIRHAEALIRMRDAEGGLVFPDSFIPIAEKSGRIQAIDHWVLGRAIETLARHPGLCLSINLSANAMDDETLLPSLRSLLRHHKIDAERVTFELTETVAVNSLFNATRLMQRIHALGCRFSLDDFGSGFASYAYLRRLPVDNVKIDGEFVRGLAESESDRIFVKAITDIAHSLGKRVVAEFVESSELMEILREMGVEYAQGYHIGRPMPEDALMERLGHGAAGASDWAQSRRM